MYIVSKEQILKALKTNNISDTEYRDIEFMLWCKMNDIIFNNGLRIKGITNRKVEKYLYYRYRICAYTIEPDVTIINNNNIGSFRTHVLSYFSILFAKYTHIYTFDANMSTTHKAIQVLIYLIRKTS